MSIYITCINCGREFEFTNAEQKFYQSKNFEMPKRCKACREAKKSEADIGDIFKLGYKKNSFVDNAKIYGVGTDVEGGLSIEHKYVFKLQSQDEIVYIKFDEENKKIYETKNIEEATTFIWSNDLKEVQCFLEKEYPKSNLVLYPISSYSHLRN